MVEQYNQARLRLQEVQARLADVRAQAQRAQATADRAISSLNANAARAYQRRLADRRAVRLGLPGRLLRPACSSGAWRMADSDLAVEAESAQQEARWTAAELKATAEERQGIVDALLGKQDQIESRVAEARDLYEELDRKYHEALAAQASAQEPAASTVGGGSPIPLLPAPNANVAAGVLQAAYSMMGTPTSTAGRVPRPASTARASRCGRGRTRACTSRIRQPRSTLRPPVAQSDLQPGDLVFFYSPISHVGIYVGGA